ncbi:MAG: DUF1761 domain-containing protein [Chloroflexi bacterium]|nr:DUF1761 domain-containing protein [Chloroflexota bacterium]MDA1239740.1 DUF1761 domain-containing protein [Chloroflexota bacterium]
MDLVSPDLSYVGIVAGGIAYFALGAAWYTFLFGKRWADLRGLTAEDLSGGWNPMIMVASLVAGIVSTAVIAFMYGWGGGNGPVDGIVVGLLIGVGIGAMEGLKAVIYEKASWPLYAINTGYVVAGFALAGLVYGLIA